LHALEGANPAFAKSIADPENRKWYMLGALGPALGDFIPSEGGGFGSSGRTPYYNIWKNVFRIAVGDPAASLPGLVPTLQLLIGTVAKITELVQARDFDGLMALKDSGALDAVNQASKDLATILNYFSDTANLEPIANLICPASSPLINNPMKLADPSQWTGRDWLHWKRTGDFAVALREHAKASGDARFIAYATGWQVAFSTILCSSGFINSITGSSYRTYWWRHRWMSNFVDTWVWGFYGANAVYGDNNQPTPGYDDWTSLCAAKLHDWIDLTGGLDPQTAAAAVVADSALPTPLPSDFTDFWLGAWNAAYGNPANPLFTESRLQAGFLLNWLVLWFQTSGEVVGCNPAPPPNPPDACDSPDPPNWIDPTKTNPADCTDPNDSSTCKPFEPQEPTPKHDPSIGEIICGILLALAGGAICWFGGWVVGAGWIAGGIVLIVDGEKQLNWDELECQLYWLDVYMFNGLSALHKLTLLAGLQHPYPSDLAEMQTTLKFGGTLPISFPTAAETLISQRLPSMLVPWGCGLLDWTNYPSGVAAEQPTAWGWYLGGLWPSAIIDDAAANPVQQDVAAPPAAYNSGIQASFGPSVQVAVRLISDPPDALPRWNLDGDRGHGWLTWQLQAAYATPLNTVAEI
jgi:hypothetical protein